MLGGGKGVKGDRGKGSRLGRGEEEEQNEENVLIWRF